MVRHTGSRRPAVGRHYHHAVIRHVPGGSRAGARGSAGLVFFPHPSAPVMTMPRSPTAMAAGVEQEAAPAVAPRLMPSFAQDPAWSAMRPSALPGSAKRVHGRGSHTRSRKGGPRARVEKAAIGKRPFATAGGPTTFASKAKGLERSA